MNSDNLPARRASDNDRNAVTAILSDAFSAGQLSVAEFDKRTGQLVQATYRHELQALVTDLVDPDTDIFSHQHFTDLTSPATKYITPAADGTSASLALMGGVERQGQWSVSPTHVSLAMMGGVDMNLLEAEFVASDTTIWANACMGGVTIVVPEDMKVHCDGIGIMGGYAMKDDPSVTMSISSLPADAPVLRIRGVALMGGVEVIRAARGAEIDIER